MKPDIFTFVSYRSFLETWFRWKKEESPKFSYRTFAEEVGAVSFNYLQRVIAGTRSFAIKYLDDFARVLELSERERDYFELLVELEQTDDPRRKSILTKRMLIAKSREGKALITEERLRYFEEWYRPIIRELATLHGDNSPAELGKKCFPQLSAKEVREAIRFLIDFNFLEKTETGYRQISTTVTTGDEISSSIVRDFHAENLKVTAELIHDVPPSEREVSSLTFAVSESTYSKMKEEIRQFRKRLIALAQEDNRPERVYQASFQLLPRSEKSGGNHA